MPRSLLFVCITAFLTGCTQTGTYYEADARGGFRKIPDVLPGYQAALRTLSTGEFFNMIFELSGGERSGAQVRLTLHLENTSAVSINSETHRFLAAGELSLEELSVVCAMQI